MKNDAAVCSFTVEVYSFDEGLAGCSGNPFFVDYVELFEMFRQSST